MKRKGFTLVECLISLFITCFLILIAPPLISHSMVDYEEQVFLREFEQSLNLAQITATTTDVASFVTVLGGDARIVKVQLYGAPELNKTIHYPESIDTNGVLEMVYTGSSGNVRKFKSFVFYGKYHVYRYIFQLGGAKYYVETSDR